MLMQVKPLGVLAMIDDGELDWKIIAINSDDAKASSVNDIEDVERLASQLHVHSTTCIFALAALHGLAQPCPVLLCLGVHTFKVLTQSAVQASPALTLKWCSPVEYVAVQCY